MSSPRRIASQLRKIASNIEASSNPSRELVAKDIKRVVAGLGKTATDDLRVKYLMEQEDHVVMHQVIITGGEGSISASAAIEQDGGKFWKCDPIEPVKGFTKGISDDDEVLLVKAISKNFSTFERVVPLQELLELVDDELTRHSSPDDGENLKQMIKECYHG